MEAKCRVQVWLRSYLESYQSESKIIRLFAFQRLIFNKPNKRLHYFHRNQNQRMLIINSSWDKVCRYYMTCKVSMNPNQVCSVNLGWFPAFSFFAFLNGSLHHSYHSSPVPINVWSMVWVMIACLCFFPPSASCQQVPQVTETEILSTIIVCICVLILSISILIKY